MNMQKIITLIVFTLLSTFYVVGQTDYHVDATNGDDNNNGTSPAMAWQTIDKVNDQVFTAGDRVLFKRGEVWKGEQLEVYNYSGTEAEPIFFSSYGSSSDEKPIITNILTHTHTWTNEGGDLWKAVNPPAYHPERLWVDDEEVLRANTFNELDGVNFLWYYDGEENGDLYLYADTNPGGKELSYTDSHVALYVENASYVNFYALDLQGGWTSVYVNSNTSYIKFESMDIGKYASGGIYINSEDTSTPNNITIIYCAFDAGFTLDFSMAATTQNDYRGCSDALFIRCLTDSEIRNSYFKNWGHASINLDGLPVENDEIRVSYISVHNNYCTSPDIPYGGRIGVDDAHHCEIYKNEIIQTSVQSQFAGHDNHYHHNIIDGTRNPSIIDNSIEISAGISVESYSSTPVYNNVFENNLIKNIEGAGFRLTNSGFYDMYDNIIRNNIMYNCGTVEGETGIGIRVQNDTEDCQIFDNAFLNNLVYNETTTQTVDFRGTVSDISAFNAINETSGQQVANNIASNPLLVDIDNGVYHLTSNSPCIDAGTTTLSTMDFEGSPIPYNNTVPEIGLYEYMPTVATDDTVLMESIIVYPNPTNGYLYFNVDSGIEVISMVNSTGAFIAIKDMKDGMIDVSTLPSGVYILNVRLANGWVRQKIIKIQ